MYSRQSMLDMERQHIKRASCYCCKAEDPELTYRDYRIKNCEQFTAISRTSYKNAFFFSFERERETKRGRKCSRRVGERERT